MNHDQIQKLRSETVDEIKGQLPALNDAELAAVRAAEEADAKPRKTLVDAISDEQAERAKNNGSGEGTDRAAEGSAAPAPKWQAEDYTGPLTADQAQWRLHNIKPAGVITK